MEENNGRGSSIPSLGSCGGRNGPPLPQRKVASGAIELLATALALQGGMLPSAGGVELPDEPLKLDGLLQENRVKAVRLALCNSFAFGGLNAVIALRRYRHEADGSADERT